MKGTAAVIEDNQECQYLAKYLLEQAGYVVYCAGSGAEGIELAKRVQPGVVLLDIELPDMDGCAVVRLLRQTAGFEKTPVIALTAHAMVGDRERFLAAGCTGYIEKPIDPGSFVSSVEKHFGPERSAGPNVRPKRVLVVDDKQEGRYQLQVFLGSKGFEVLEAENGAEALQKAREQKPDLIVSDILRPVMDGFSL
ncbi:MAG: response regulator, partial [Verrucomicrobiae bacterium]|nr:response regulator [Verrucomicrobiae bacterium]